MCYIGGDMKKIAMNIAEQQKDRLKALSQRRGVTQAELLRRFLEDGLEREEHRLFQSRTGKEETETHGG